MSDRGKNERSNNDHNHPSRPASLIGAGLDYFGFVDDFRPIGLGHVSAILGARRHSRVLRALRFSPVAVARPKEVDK